MKRIKKFLKNNAKFLVGIIVGGLVIGGSVYAATVIGAGEVSYTNNSQTSVQSALDDLYTKANSSAAVKYHAGDTVTYQGESFQVLHDVMEGQIQCEIFCKHNLNADATAQVSSSTESVFSSTAYWSSSWVNGTKLNLNLMSGYTETDAIGKTKSYAKTKGALNGRLLTYDEANIMENSLKSAITNMLRQGNLKYWLGNSYEGNSGTSIYYFNSTSYKYPLDFRSYGSTGVCIRPVLTVLVSQLS